MTSLRRGPSGPLVDIAAGDESFGSQTAWAIDPLLGSDENQGTPSLPLRTMAEFNARFTGLTVTAVATLQLVGDVIDASLQLPSARFANGASLTVSGTRTDVGSGLVTAVTGLGDTAARFPWQVTTSGINWLAVSLNAQVRLSNGVLGMIVEVIDANNVVLGPVSTASPASSVTAAPVVGTTVTIATLSRALPPQIGSIGNFGVLGFQLVLQHLSFDSPVGFGITGPGQHLYVGGLGVLFFGCVINYLNAGSYTFYAACPFSIRCCRWNATVTVAWRSSMESPQINGLVVAGSGATLYNHQSGWFAYTALVLIGARFFNTGAQIQIGGAHSRKTSTSCFTIQNGGYINSVTSPINSGPSGNASGNTGIGIDVPDGRLGYSGAGNKPLVTGTSDTRVNGTTKAYANIPFIAYDATVPANFTGNGSSIVQV